MNARAFKVKNVIIRNTTDGDCDFILKTNRENVEVLSPMRKDDFCNFKNRAQLFLTVEVDGAPAAFLIALREGVETYKSENYLWFSKNYEKFLYIDRVVIAEGFRGCGIGKKLYSRVFEEAKKTGVPFVTAEIDTVPYNEASLLFHKAMGFNEVGTQTVRGGAVTVSLQAADLGL